MSPNVVRGAAAAVAWAVLVLVFGSGSSVPEEFASLSTRFEEATTIQADFYWEDPKTQKEHYCELRLTDRDLALIDVSGARLSLKEGSVLLVTPDISPPIPALNNRATDLYEEFRAGFSNSEWSIVDPSTDASLAERADLLWGRIVLPFSWAEGHEVFVGIAKEGALPEVIIIRTAGSRLGVSYRQHRGGATTMYIADGPELWIGLEDIRLDQVIAPGLLNTNEHP